MQKKLIALAIAGLTSAGAFAADNVTIYGRMDYGYLTRSGTSGGNNNAETKGEFGSGLQSGSRIGFKGAEDLGNGLKAIFQAEFGIAVDQATVAGSTAAWTNRNSYVGLTGGFGTVVGGRLDGVRYGIFNKYDPFAGGTVGNFTQMTLQVDRADNAIAYISPNFSGFTVTAAYATSAIGAEGVGNRTNAGLTSQASNDLQLNTLMANYENGPLSLTADYETVKGTKERTQANEQKQTVWTLAGSYDFGMVKLSALYDSHRADAAGVSNAADFRNWFVGAKIPFMGKFTGKVNYGRVNDRVTADADSSKFGLGLDYALSKRTNLYVDYGKIHNDNNATRFVSAAANQMNYGNNFGSTQVGGLGSNAGRIGVTGFDIGVAHNF